MKKCHTWILVISTFCFAAAVNAQDAALKTPGNFKASPYTGYTRAHWLEITERIIAGALPYFDKTSGRPEIPPAVDAFAKYQKNFQEANIPSLRALERIMTGVIFYNKATGKDKVPGYNGSITRPFMDAIIKGTDTTSESYWGNPQQGDQVGSVFAMAMYISPNVFWNPLTDKQKRNVLSWFEKQVYNKAGNNNFYYFRMTVVGFLESHGYKANREHLTQMFERLMGWYQGDGWFLDGVNRGIDYYNIWAFQMYNQIIYKYDPVWRQRFGERIRITTDAFLESFPFLFGRDGGPIPWGRSLTYRFACNASIGWTVLNGNSKLPPGQARRIASGALKYFWENGCTSRNGLLSVGYRGENTSMAEMYIASFDPYWAMQGMSCLMIPENDPFWTDSEVGMPADGAGGRLALKGPQLALKVSPVDGEARLFPVGQPFYNKPWMGQVAAKYNQHAYSSYLGFCTSGEGSEETGAGRSGYSYDGKRWFYRDKVKSVKTDTDHLVSLYPLRPPNDSDLTPDSQLDEMETHTLLGREGELHIFWHTYPDPIYLYLGGYGIAVPSGSEMIKHHTADGLMINGGDNYSLLQTYRTPKGKTDAILLKPRDGWTSSHLFGGQGAYTYWTSDTPVRPRAPVVIYVNGTRKRIPVPEKISIEEMSGKLKIRFEGKWYLIEVPGFLPLK